MNRKQRRAEQKHAKAPSPSDPRALLSEALNHHQAGRLGSAEALYQRVLTAQPRNADALHLYGVLACRSARPELGAELIARAIAVDPNQPSFHLNLGNAFQMLDRRQEAATSFSKVLEREPNHPIALNGLADALQALGDIEAAIPLYRRALEMQPANPAALNNLGGALQRLGRSHEAMAALRQALALRSEFPEALSNLGNAQQSLRWLDEAIESYRHALALDPSMVETYYNFANVLRLRGLMDQAIGCYRQALTLAPADQRILTNLGMALRARGRHDEALELAAEAAAARPGVAAVHDDLGRSLQELGRLTEAIACFERSLELDPNLLSARSSLADALSEQGRVAEAIALQRENVARTPDDPITHDKLLFTVQYLPEATERSLLDEALAWGARHAPGAGSIAAFANERSSDRRLRIGYLSNDFRNHSCAFYVLPLLQQHDRAAVEVFAYSEDRSPDAETERFQAASDRWRSVQGLGDQALAAMIREDAIDILVHLSAHTEGSRLGVAPLGPAPIQANWMGLGSTSGVSAIDYFITDRFLAPPESDPYFSETVLHLPGCAFCYEPPEPTPEIGPPPALANGHVTFGCLSRAIRLNDRVLEVWARVLRAVPGARLLLNSLAMADVGARDRILTFFGARGVTADRLALICTRGRQAALESYGGIDVALDPFPHNAGLTSYEALHMGVPLVTRADRPPQGRYGVSVLSNLGLEDLIAWDDESYVQIAAALAADPDRLKALRYGMRERMRASPLRDHQAFARAMEAGYREMWTRWLDKQALDG